MRLVPAWRPCSRHTKPPARTCVVQVVALAREAGVGDLIDHKLQVGWRLAGALVAFAGERDFCRLPGGARMGVGAGCRTGGCGRHSLQWEAAAADESLRCRRALALRAVAPRLAPFQVHPTPRRTPPHPTHPTGPTFFQPGLTPISTTSLTGSALPLAASYTWRVTLSFCEGRGGGARVGWWRGW